MVYMYPFNVIDWVKQVLLAGTLSTLLGAIYLGLRWRYWDRSWVASAQSGGGPVFEQDNLSDRLGFYHVLMAVGLWPGVLMSSVSAVWKAKSAVTRDLDDGLYSKTAYAVAKGTLNLVSSGGVFLAYVIPGYLLAGLHYPQQDEDLDIFYFYIGRYKIRPF